MARLRTAPRVQHALAYDLLDLFAWGTAMALACSFMVLTWVFTAEVGDQTRQGLCPQSMLLAMGVCAGGYTTFMMLTFIFGTTSQGEGHARRSICCNLSIWWILEFVAVLFLVTAPGFVLLGTTEAPYTPPVRIQHPILVPPVVGNATLPPTAVFTTAAPTATETPDEYELEDPLEKCSKGGPRMVYISAIVLPIFIWVIAVVAQSTRFGMCVPRRYTRAAVSDDDRERHLEFSSSSALNSGEGKFSITDEIDGALEEVGDLIQSSDDDDESTMP